VFKRCKEFLEGRVSIKDEPRSGRFSTSKTDKNVKKLRALMRSDGQLTVRMIASDLNLNHTTVHQILTQELAMRKLCAKIVPKKTDNRTEGQTEGHVSSSSGTDPKGQKFLEEHDYRRRNMDI